MEDCKDGTDLALPVLCLVCGDRSSGRHYGVLTCDGCRGFFKRSVRRGLGYECREKNTCVVDLSRRNQCQACRMKKCLDVGMKKEAVQHERAPRLPKNRTHHFSPYPRVVDYGKLAATATTPRSNKGHSATMTPPYSPKKTNPVVTVDELFEISVQFLYETITWVRNIPSFGDLPLKVQTLLLSRGWCPLFLLTLSHCNISIPVDLLLEHAKLSKSPETKRKKNKEMEESVIRDLNVLLSLIHKFKNLNLDAIEFSCVKAILLCNPELGNLKSRTQVERLQDQAQIVLQEHSSSKPSLGRFGKILIKLPLLSTISSRLVEMHFFRGSIESVKELTSRGTASALQNKPDENNNENINIKIEDAVEKETEVEEEIEVEIIDLDNDE